MISICIPTYEQRGAGAHMLTALLESIQMQQFNFPFEIVISDNATDGTIKAVCDKYHKLPIHYYFNPVRGASENINNAIDLAKYDKIKLMMQDDLFVHPMALAAFNAALDFNGWVVSNSLHINAQGTRVGQRIAEYDPLNFDTNTIGMPSVIAFRKTDIRFDARLKTFCDLYFYYQLYQAYGMPLIIPGFNIGQRFHNASQSRNQPPSHKADKNFLIRQGLIPGTLPKVVVAVVVYNRWENIDRWVSVWKQCETAGAQLVIIANDDNVSRVQPAYFKDSHAQNVIVLNRPNVGYDIGAFQDVCRNRLPGFPDYDYLLWCTDDTIPMDPNFISKFTDPFEKGIGLTCMQISSEYTYHVRTTGFCIPKTIARRLKFPADPITTKQECLHFEHQGHSRTMYRQIIIGMRQKIVQVTPLEQSPLYDMGFWYRNAEAKKVAHLHDRMAEHYKIFPTFSNEKVTT